MLRGRSLGQAIGVVALFCATFGVSTASAQVDYEIMASLQFNFSNPGARSLAMAGALTGAGDDATGAWTNPGGLTNITRPEVGVEFRGFDFATPFVSAGRFNGHADEHRRRHRRRAASTASREDIDAQPRRSSRRWCPKSRFAFAFYRTEARQLRGRTSRPTGMFFDDPDDAHPVARVPATTARSSCKIANFGGSAAVRLTDQVSVGVGVSFYDFEHRLVGRCPLRRFRRPVRPPGSFVRPAAPTTASNVVSRRSHRRGEDYGAFGVNIGASISPNDTFRIGASYRQGPKFDIALPSRATSSADHRRRPASSRCPT